MPAGLITIFDSAGQARRAFAELERAGFDTSKLSLIGKEEPSEGHQLGVAVAGEHASLWGRHRALWNCAESTAALALAWVPFIGHMVALGPAAAALVAADWQAPGHARTSALKRLLAFAGASGAEMRTLHDAVRDGQILLLVHGSEMDAIKARAVLERIVPANARV